VGGNPRYVFILYTKNMKKSFLFGLMAILLAGFWFGGASLAADYTWNLVSEFGWTPIITAKLVLKVWEGLDNWALSWDNIQCDGDNFCKILANSNKEVQLPEPLLSGKENCNFAGWYNNLDDVKKWWIWDTLKISSTTTLYAKWICNEWAVQVRNQFYNSFEEALAALPRKDYNKIILLQDVNYSMTEDDTYFRIEKNGYNITVTPAEWYVMNTPVETNGYVEYKQVLLSNQIYKVTTPGWNIIYKENTVFDTDGTWQLLKDYTRTSKLTEGTFIYNVILDLNWYTITSTAWDAAISLGRDWTESEHRIFSIIDTSNDKWWKIIATWLNPAESSDALISIFWTYNDVIIWEGVILEWWAVTIFGNNNVLDVYWTVNWWDDFGIAANGANTTNATINIHEWAEISSNQTAIYLPWKTNLIATIDGKVTWKTAVEIRAGMLTIWENAELIATWEFSEAANWNWTTIDGAALAISQHTTNLPINVTVNWWIFSWSKAVYEEDLQDETTEDAMLSIITGEFNWDINSENITWFINGWIFSVEPNIEYVVEWYEAVSNENGKYVIQAKTYTVEITKTTNGTVTADKASAAQWETVTLTVTPDVWYELDKLTVNDSNENEVTLIENKFTMPAGDVTVGAIFKLKSCAIIWNYKDSGWNDVTETWAVAYSQAPSHGNPATYEKDGKIYTFIWWTKEGVEGVVTLADEVITWDVTYTATYDEKAKPSWSSGGWGGWSSKTSASDEIKAITSDNAKDDSKTDDETKANENGEENANEEGNKDENKVAPMTETQAVEKFGQEQIDAYKWALENGITTMKTVESARLDEPLTRAELAKMMVVYIQKVLKKDPVVTWDVNYPDVKVEEIWDLVDYVKLAYQYQIMWINADGTPIELFNSHGIVSRWEYATVFSRVLFGAKFNKSGEDFYTNHLEALKSAGILTNTLPSIQEMRGWVMLMMYRSSQNGEAIEKVANSTEKVENVEKADETASEETVNVSDEEKSEGWIDTDETTKDSTEESVSDESSETSVNTPETTTWDALSE